MKNKIKIYLDDERKAPEGWIQCRWPHEVITLIRNGNVDTISLDHDLGEGYKETGMDVLDWLEEKVYTEKNFTPPSIIIHTQNSAKLPIMREVANRIHRQYVKNAFDD